jgi:gliding motility-associated-like protein
MRSCNFTKNARTIVFTALLAVLSFSVHAQTYLAGTLQSGKLASGVAVDASGNVYVMQFNSASGTPDGGGGTGEVVKYAANNLSGTPTVIATGIPDADNASDDYAVGIVVDPINGDVFVVSDNQDVNNIAPYGIIYKLANNGNGTYTKSAWITGNANLGYPAAIAIDASGNLYVDNYNGINNYYEIDKYTRGSTSPTALYQGLDASQLNESQNSPYFYASPSGLAVNSNGSIIYLTEDFDDDGAYNDQGHIDKLTLSGSTYTKSVVSSGFSATALALDANGNLFASQTTTANTATGPASPTDYNPNYGLYEYPGGNATQSPTKIYTPLHAYTADLFPFGIAIINDNNIFVTDGQTSGGSNSVLQISGTPTSQAINVSFTGTTTSGTSISWTNGNGGSRAVFMAAASSGAPAPINGTAYTANTAFASGTQIGGSGWYCIYNGTGTSVNVTGLTAGTTYRVMAVEYNGNLANQNYLTSTATNNPNIVTTLAPTIATTGTPSALSTTAGTASSSTSFSVSGSNLTANVTATAPSGFDISLDNSTWSTSGGNVTLTESSGTLNSAPVYIRLDAGDAATTYSSSVIALTSTGATTVNVAIPASTVSAALPVVTTTGGTTNYTGTAVNVDNGITVSDAGSTTLASGTASITSGFSSGNDALNFTNQNGITGSYNASTGVLTLSGSASLAHYQTALQSITFNTSSTSAGSRTVSFMVNDGSNNSNTATKTINVAAAAPTVTSVATTAGTYGIGQSIPFIVNMSSPVNVSTIGGAPQIPITIGTKSTVASYVAGSGTSTLTFDYTVVLGDNGSVGIGSAITLPVGTTIQSTSNSTDAILTLNNIGSTSGVIIDAQPPTVSSITATTPSNATPTSASSLIYTVTFSEAVTGVDQTDFTVTTTSGSATGAVTSVSGSGSTYTVTVSSISGTGSLRLDLNSSGTGIADLANNAISGGFTNGDVYTITQPASVITFASTANTTYGAADFAPGATSTNTVTPITYTSSNTAVATIVSGNIHVVGAGTTTITASQAAGNGFSAATDVQQTLTVAPVTLTVTGTSPGMTYGGSVPTLGVTYSGFVNGDTQVSLTAQPTATTTATSASPVGSYPVTPGGGAATNYTFNYVNGTLTVNPAQLTVTPAATATMVYGGSLPGLTVSYSGFVNGDGPSAVTTPPTISTTATAASPVGNYPITATGAAATNYTFVYNTGTLTITPAPLTITASDQSMTYGSAVPTLTANYNGFVNGDNASNLITAPTFATTATSASPVGTYPITASGAADPNYTITYQPGTMTVTAAPLTVTASDQSMMYGSAIPVLTVTYNGFVNGDNASSLTTAPTVSTTATSASPAGTYPITASGAVDPNYAINYAAGTMTIGKATLTVTGISPTMTYGAAVPTLGVTYSGFVNGDTQASLTTQPTATTTATSSSPVGTYPVTPSGGVSANYTFNYVPGTLTVGPAQLDVTANNATMTYGGAFPVLGVTYSGFVNGDNASGLTTAPSLSVTATPSSPVGTYTITPMGAVDPNYTFVYHNGTLTITPAALTITASNATMVYGSSVPTLIATYSGFANGDSPGSLTTQPTVSTTVTSASPVGTYPITASGAVDPNYTISYVPGTITIAKAPLTVTADDKLMPLGGPLPALTVSYTGFLNGDNASSLTTQPTASTTATAGSPAGNYPITASGGSSSNYTFSYVNGTLTVQKAILTITALPASSTYGSALVSNGSLTVSYSGFINGDNASSLTVPPVVTNTCFTGAPVGTYALIPSGAVDPNYNIVYVNGTYSVTPASLNITANNGTMTYGGTVPTLTASYTGFVNGDAAGSLTVLPTLSTTAASASPVGTYPVTASGAVDPNYTITYTPGAITVTPASLTVTANNNTMTYGDPVPTLTATYSGFVNGDNAASLSTAPTLSTTATSASPVGAYPVTASGAVDPNYTFSYVPGILTVGTRLITVAANAQTKVYGTTDPALTYQLTTGSLVNGDSFIGSLTRDPGEAVGTYAINQGTLALNGNYALTYNGASLTITAAQPLITLAAMTKSYGDADFDPGATSTNTTMAITYTSDNAAVATIVNGKVHIVGAGTANITASQAAGTNYSAASATAQLTVSKLVIAVTATAQSKIYGDADPSLSYTFTPALAAGDSFSGSLTRTAGESVGTYAINQGTLSLSSNYTLTFTGANLTITTRDITVTANAQTKVYGQADPALTYQVTTGSLAGTDAFSGALTRDPGENVGTYAINQGTLALNSNYTLTYTGANFTITPATATLALSNLTQTYDGIAKSVTVTVTPSGLSGVNVTYNGSATAPVAAGSYAVIASLSNSNYTAVNATGTLVISDEGQVITFAALPAKTYGDADFAPGATSNNSGIPITYVSSNTAVATIVGGNIHIVGAGTATITASQAGDANHTAAADQQQTLTVSQATLTITAANQTRPYGQPNPTLTVSYAGFVNGDAISSLSSPATASTTATMSSAPGQYPITVSGAASVNYSMKYVSGTLTVTPLHIATLAGLSISAGTLTPGFSPSVTSYNTVIDAVIGNLGFTAIPQDPNATVTINGIGVMNGSAYMVPVSYGNNLVSITVTAQDGVTQQTYTVEVTRKPTVAMIKPTNILTPNGDGVNDTWQVPDINLFPDNYVQVYDRGGRRVFYKKGYTNDWSGTVDNHQLGEGTYYYVVYLGAGLDMIYGYITILNNH